MLNPSRPFSAYLQCHVPSLASLPLPHFANRRDWISFATGCRRDGPKLAGAVPHINILMLDDARVLSLSRTPKNLTDRKFDNFIIWSTPDGASNNWDRSQFQLSWKQLRKVATFFFLIISTVVNFFIICRTLLPRSDETGDWGCDLWWSAAWYLQLKSYDSILEVGGLGFPRLKMDSELLKHCGIRISPKKIQRRRLARERDLARCV